MKLVVIGANGQLGSDLSELATKDGHEITKLTHADISVEDIDSVHEVLKSIKPTYILNTAAYHNVPLCEENPSESYAVNSIGALNVSRVASDLGSIHVYYSTDYVFDGAKGIPYVETDRPNPLNVYATTKLAGEYHTLAASDKNLVLRISGVYGKVPCRAKGSNFVTTIIRLAAEKKEVRVVTDEILTPTSSVAIAHGTLDLLKMGAGGLIHLTSEGECSWYDFAKVIFDTLELKTPLLRASVSDFPVGVKRPAYSVLGNRRLESLGVNHLPHWKDSLETFLRVTIL